MAGGKRTRSFVLFVRLFFFKAGPILDVDVFGIPAAFLHGLLAYQYFEDYLLLEPSLPDGVLNLTQQFPVRFGNLSLCDSRCPTRSSLDASSVRFSRPHACAFHVPTRALFTSPRTHPACARHSWHGLRSARKTSTLVAHSP